MDSPTQQLRSLLQVYKTISLTFVDTYALVSDIRSNLKSGQYTLEEIVNFIYVMREVSKFGDEIRKECNGVRTMLEQVCCVLYVQEHLNDPSNADPVRASLATGTPSVRQAARLPNRKTEPKAYETLLKHFGMNDECLKLDVVRPHWVGIGEYVTTLMEDGKSLPPGIKPGDTYPVYSVIIRATQNLDELIEKMLDVEKDLRAQFVVKLESAYDKVLTIRPIQRMQRDKDEEDDD